MFVFVGCKTPTDITYFQDAENNTSSLLNMSMSGAITIQPNDKLSIFVKTRDEQITSLFNIASSNVQMTGSSARGYNVDSRGYIDFPELGKIYVNGKTREEISNYIKFELEGRNLVKNAVVTVEFLNMFYTVLGEVGSPGRKEITKDYITILDAIAESGDLTINGLRTNVLVMRKMGDEMKHYRVNLLNAEKLYMSPVYMIKQDDIIYVESNAKKQRESTVNGNNPMTIAFWMSAASFLMAIVNFLK